MTLLVPSLVPVACGRDEAKCFIRFLITSNIGYYTKNLECFTFRKSLSTSIPVSKKIFSPAPYGFFLLIFFSFSSICCIKIRNTFLQSSFLFSVRAWVKQDGGRNYSVKTYTVQTPTLHT